MAIGALNDADLPNAPNVEPPAKEEGSKSTDKGPNLGDVTDAEAAAADI